MKTVKLGDVCNLMTGGTPSRNHKEYFENGNIKWLVSGDIHKGEIFDCDGRITEAGLNNSNARLLPINSVMIALNGQGKTRATVAMLRTQATCNQSLVSIYPKDDKKVLPEYIYWNLRGRYDELRKLTGDAGNERRGLNMIILRNIDIPAPPSLEEQRRVVERLDAAFEKIDRAIELTEKNITETNLMKSSILTNAFNVSNSKTVKLGDVCDLMTGGTPSRSHKEYFEHGSIKWLVSGDIHKGEIFDCDGRITEAGLNNSNARLLPIDSVMIALNGQGKTRATVAMLRTQATCNQSLVSIYPKDDKNVLPEYIYWNLKGRYEELRKLTGDAGNERRGLNMIILRNIDIPAPPSLEEQRRVVERLDAAFEKIDATLELRNKKLMKLKELRQSALTQAFSGSGVE